MDGEKNYVVAAFYHFTRFDSPDLLKPKLLDLCKGAGLCGTILLASEGINGTVAGGRSAIDRLLSYLRTLPGCDNLEHKESYAEKKPFNRMKVRLKKEIVSMGVEDLNPANEVGIYVDPQEWNALLEDPDVIIVDTRNDYEVQIGTFENAMNPKTESFRDMPDWMDRKINDGAFEGKKVAMFCTGGIRCEKSTSYLVQKGVDSVYHLKGGILKYLENIPEEKSKFRGECFVFDQRVSVKHRLELGEYEQCFACRRPITVDQMQSPSYVKGISCPHCFDETSEEQKARFSMRERQLSLKQTSR